MARGIIGGIVLSTLVTLVLVPVFYVLIERLRSGRGLVLRAPSDNEPTPADASLPETAIRTVTGDGHATAGGLS
jgi:hypothetical protein